MDGQLSIFDFPEYLPSERQEVNIRGICDDGYCPKCDSDLQDLIDECPDCHTKLDWTRWKRINNQEA